MAGKILVVDDDRSVVSTITAILEEEGLEADIAEDGLEALEKLETCRPAVILLDMMMPRLDGYGFLERLRKLGVRSRYAVVVLTADVRFRQQAASMDVEGWLEKPFSYDALVSQVRRFLP